MVIIQVYARITADLFFGTANYTAFDLTGIRVFEHQTETYVPMKIFNSMFTKHFFSRLCPYKTPARFEPWEIWFQRNVRTASAVFKYIFFPWRLFGNPLSIQFHGDHVTSVFCNFSISFCFIFLLTQVRTSQNFKTHKTFVMQISLAWIYIYTWTTNRPWYSLRHHEEHFFFNLTELDSRNSTNRHLKEPFC